MLQVTHAKGPTNTKAPQYRCRSINSLLGYRAMPNKQSLPLEYWGLERWPFRGSVGENQFYPTAGHDEALARIEYLVESQRRLGVLVGEAGIGKSLILRVAAKRLIRTGAGAVVIDALGASV